MWSRLCLVHMSMPEVLLSIRQNRHPLHARSGGLGELPPAGSGRAGKRSAARPPRLAGLVSQYQGSVERKREIKHGKTAAGHAMLGLSGMVSS